MDRWQSIKAFISIIESRSYTTAASRLGLSRSHLSKQIIALEDNLGVRLLNRTTKHVSPTDIGQAYYNVCARLADELEDAEANLDTLRRKPRGRLRILAPQSLAVLELVDFGRHLTQRYEELDLSILIDDPVVNIVEQGFDLALKFGEQPDSTLLSRKLASFRLIVCAAPSYLAKNGNPRKPEDLRHHECLQYTRLFPTSSWWFKGPDREVEIPVKGWITSNNALFLRECILRGEGIALLPSYSVKADLKAKRLRRLLTKYQTNTRPLYVVYPGGRHITTKVRICIDLLVDWFRQKGD